MQCRGWAADAAKEMDVAHATDGLRMLQTLIDIGKLTKYQAKVLAGQSDKPLKRGPWFILQEVKNPLFNGWLEVTKVDTTKAEQAPALWAKWLLLEDLQRLKPSSPSLPRGIQLAGVEAPYLQPVMIPELQDQELQIQVGPVEGNLLADGFDASSWIDGNRIQTAQVIIDQVASALAALHQAGLHHGRVTPDRIVWTEQGATLVRDPIAVVTSDLDPQVTGLLGDHLQPLSNAHFLAPEFIAPGQPPSVTSDIFSLGCTWWWLLTGKPPATGNSAQDILAAHTKRLPDLPADLELPEPMRRVLGHCLARNHTSRFQSATELVDALRRAHASVNKGIHTQTRTIEPAAPSPDTSQSSASVESPSSPIQATPVVAKPVSKETSQRGQNPIVKAEIASEVADHPAPAPPTKKKKSKQANAKGQPTSKNPAAKAAAEKPSHSNAKASANKSSRPAPTPELVDAQRETAEAAPPASSEATSTPAVSPLAPSPVASAVSDPIAPEDAEAPDAATAQSFSSESPKPNTSFSPGPASTAATGRRRKRRKRQSNKWMVPVFGGLGFVVVLLLVLQLSGALKPGDDAAEGNTTVARPVPIPNTGRAEQITKDPMEDFYRVVSDSNTGVWAPPQIPAPIALDLLPPGSGLFLNFSPADLLAKPEAKQLLATFESEWSPLLTQVAAKAGVAVDQIQHCTVAFYPPEQPGGMPLTASRFELASAVPLAELKAKWGVTTTKKSEGHELLLAAQTAYYVTEQPLVDAQSVNKFSVGPVTLMEDVAELQGAAGPLLSPVEKLWKSTSNQYDFTLLADAPFLFTEGRGLWAQLPIRAQPLARDLFSADTKAILLQTQIDANWFFEVQVMGASEQDAGKALARVEDALRGSPQKIEQWFVNNLPHPHWRFLALRFPLMLRALNQQAKFGVERGTAVVNGYMPPAAASNIMLTGWKALQEGAYMSGGDAALASSAQPAPVQLTIEQFLDRKIRISFDQEPFEEAFDMIAEEANDGLPNGTPQTLFSLDGDAFEAAGVTRNLELREFSAVDQSVRAALTALCVKGNPVPGADVTSAEQKVVWILKDDATSAGRKTIVLTTRTQAAKENISLPPEFTP